MLLEFIILFTLFFFLAFFAEWVERKAKARAQNRVGPLFTGPRGVLQPLADFLKLMFKEEINPIGIDRLLLTVIPIIGTSIYMFMLFYIPIYDIKGLLWYPADLIFLLGLSALFGGLIIITGYANPGPYSNVGAARFGELFISYEVPFVLSVATAAIIADSSTLYKIVEFQASHYPIIICAPIGAFILFISTLAKIERVPFDVGEAETEIAAGWQVELSGRRLAFYRFSINLEMLFGVGLFVTLYLGGPLGPIILGIKWLSYVIWFFVKFFAVLIVLSVVEAVFARFRIDQVLTIYWKALTPLAILQIFLAFALKGLGFCW